MNRVDASTKDLMRTESTKDIESPTFIAQSYMVDCCCAADFERDQMLTEEGALPAADKSALSVATDDVLHFQRGSPQEVAELEPPPLQALDSVWLHRGVLSQDAKAFDLHSTAAGLGVVLRDGTALTPKGSRLGELLCAGMDLMRQPVAAPSQVASL